MEERISVIVPAYNSAAHLDSCVTSVLEQTDPCWELILVDDGSTDGTPALCDAWTARDARIRSFHQPNAGVSAARNAGLAAARGKYLAFLDSDDRMDPRCLETLRNTIGTAQLAVCGVQEDLGWSDQLTDGCWTLEEMRATPSRFTNPLYINALWNKLFLRDLVEDNQIRFPQTVRRCEDAYFVENYLLHCKKVAVTAEKRYDYVQREGSAMHSFYERVCDDELPLMRLQYDFFHGAPLAPREEQAFWDWQYGKVLAIVRYLVTYAPTARVCRERLAELCDDPLVRQSFLRPAELGRRKELYAFAVRKKRYGLLRAMVRGLERN